MPENKTVKKAETTVDLTKEIGFALPLKPIPISAYNFETTAIKKRPIIIIQKPFCEQGDQCVDLSGSSATDVNGRRTWRLSDFMCLPQYESWYDIDAPISFVATPMTGDKPTYLTTTVNIQASPKDLVVEVYSWDKQGNPAPNAGFGWRCRLAYPNVIL